MSSSINLPLDWFLRSGCQSILFFFFFLMLLLFSRSVVSDFLWPHGLQHARLPCPSPSPGVCSDLRPLSRWCHPTISSSVTLFSSCLQSFPASGSFPVSQLFASGGQSIRASGSATVLLVNSQDWLVWPPCCFIYLLIFGCAGSSFLRGVLSSCGEQLGYSPVGVLSSWWLLLLQSTGCRVRASVAVECEL